MATTSLWHIKGRLKDLIEYVENPAKTEKASLQDFFNVFSYTQNPNKTGEGEYVTAINCVKEIALEQMILTKKQFGKDDGYIAWHGYQSFKSGEVSPELCHRIGVQTAKELWGEDFQIIVTTHLDKEHLHNHFCFNAVGFRDGRKYNYSKAERQRMMEVSDRICMEFGLSVIQKQKQSPSRPVWEDEKRGKPTRYNIYRADVEKAMYGSRRVDLMERYLVRLGYEVDFTGEKWKIKLPQYRYFTHLETLNPAWTPAYIRQHLGVRTSYGNHRAMVSAPQNVPEEVRSAWKVPLHRTSLQKLFIWWQYQLGILPKRTPYQPTSPLIREELRKMENLDKQTRFLADHHIETIEDLHSLLADVEQKMQELIFKREKLQNKMRRAEPEEKEEYRQQKQQITQKITALRSDKKLILGIEDRAVRIYQTMDRVMANEEKEKQRVRETRTRERSRGR